MDLKPTVSVIIPTYNRAHLIGRAIQSVLKQTYQDFEVIVVDDGSIDNTEEVVKKIQENRVYYYKHDKNKGGSAARNTGISLAKGKYIAFQDSDDEWLPEKLNQQINIFKNLSADVGLIYTDMWRIDSKGQRHYWKSPGYNKENNIINCKWFDDVKNIGIQTVVIKRECFEKAGIFDEEFRRFIDLELFLRLSKYCRFYHLKSPLVIYYDVGEGISHNVDSLVQAYDLIFKKYDQDEIFNKRSLSRHLYSLGNYLCQEREINSGQEYFLKAIKKDPYNLKAYLAFMISLMGKDSYSNFIMVKRRIFDFLRYGRIKNLK